MKIPLILALASERATIVTDIELIQHAYEEVQWYKALEKDDVLLQGARSVKAKVLQKVLTKMLNKVKAELAVFDAPFEFDGVDAKSIINAIIKASGMEKATSVEDKVFTSVEKTLEKEKMGTSTEKTVVEHEAIGAEAPGVEDMELGPEQPARNLLPFLLLFGRKAPAPLVLGSQHKKYPTHPAHLILKNQAPVRDQMTARGQAPVRDQMTARGQAPVRDQMTA
ncbi:hypothetical protein C2845_PM15G09960 [Panicum miliaceum]|uniref:Uncharacterized protein n=1 Tax=Panicum miliaceum TaxID=4540 RepID=A0A3L6Q9R5_PANMI|nr:hypothetical protein C2845_PM15G09960 [Panicum miliaceum]